MSRASNVRTEQTHRLPTNTTTARHSVHRWANITAGYSPEFVYSCIERDSLDQDNVVLDPFTGMATTQVAANALGISAIGFEPQIHFWHMAVAKTASRSAEHIELYRTVLHGLTPHTDVTEVWNETQLTYLNKLIPSDQLALLATAKEYLATFPEPARPLFRLVVSRLLEFASGSATDGIYKAPTTSKRAHDIKSKIDQILDDILQDIVEMPSAMGVTTIFNQSAEDMSEVQSESVDLIVTSPPYLNNFDFAEMARMEMYFWNYVANWGEMTEKVRANLVVNTTTAPSRFKRDQEQWRSQLSSHVLSQLDAIVDSLKAARREKSGKKDYEKLVVPYFSQMAKIIGECYRVLSRNRNLDLVVADAALYGVHIHTEEILAQLMSEIGFQDIEIIRLRDRGTRWILAKRQGAQGTLGEFHIKAHKG